MKVSKPTLQIILGGVLIANGALMGLPLWLAGGRGEPLTMLETALTGLFLGMGGLFVAIGLQARSKRG